MIEKALVKIVFLNNSFQSEVDIFSYPIISTILSTFDMIILGTNINYCDNIQHYLSFERGSDNPRKFRQTNPKYVTQFELFELVFQYRSNYQTTTRISKRKHSTMSHRLVDTIDTLKKELSWCITKNYKQLVNIDNTQNRYCLVNTNDMNANKVVTSLNDYPHMQNIRDEIDLNCQSHGIQGYMKIFAQNAKHVYLASLNYRNNLNLSSRLIVYFDIMKYFQLNTENIFRLSLTTHL